MAVWPVSHSKQFITELAYGQFIENPVLAKSHHDHITMPSNLQVVTAELSVRFRNVVESLRGRNGAKGVLALPGEIVIQAN